jgi:hypothetical protein
MNIEIDIHNFDSLIQREDLQSKKLVDLVKYDSFLRIKLDGEVVYDDWICLLELNHVIEKWGDRINKKLYETYEYVSEDNDHNPIFSFIYNNEENSWSFYSVFGTTFTRKKMFLQDIKNFMKKFTDELMKYVTEI